MPAHPQIALREVAALWDSDAFAPALQAALSAVAPETLGLQHCTSQGGVISGPIAISLLSGVADDAMIRLRVSALFAETVGGCSCGDDPYQVQAAATLLVLIDRRNGRAQFHPEDSETHQP